MASRLIQSVIWICGLSGLGYGLLVLTTQSEDKLLNTSKDYPGLDKDPERKTKSQQFTDVLQAASKSEKPLYLMTKKEIENLSKK